MWRAVGIPAAVRARDATPDGAELGPPDFLLRLACCWSHERTSPRGLQPPTARASQLVPRGIMHAPAGYAVAHADNPRDCLSPPIISHPAVALEEAHGHILSFLSASEEHSSPKLVPKHVQWNAIFSQLTL